MGNSSLRRLAFPNPFYSSEGALRRFADSDFYHINIGRRIVSDGLLDSVFNSESSTSALVFVVIPFYSLGAIAVGYTLAWLLLRLIMPKEDVTR